ncbi:MAG: hypothetical protein ACKV2T_00775 [Kofleriaceae bacterium]
MTRPPRPETQRPVRTDLVLDNGRLDYLPIDFAGFVDLAKRVAGGAIAPNAGDPTHTLYELSALVAHVLAVHQDYYAGEAFLRTATSPRQLVRHGRRFGYEPSPGSTAVGFVEIVVKPELEGELPAGIVVSTLPRAGAGAEELQTLTPRFVDAGWNRIEIRASDREVAIPIAATATSIRVSGTNLGLRAGEPAMLVGPTATIGLDIASLSEANGETSIGLARALGTAIVDPAGYRLVAAPSLEVRLFGWDADPSLFPTAALETAGVYVDPGPSSTTHGYATPSDPAAGKIFLSHAIDDQLVGQRVLVAKGDVRSVYMVTAQENTGVQFVRGGWRQELDHIDIIPAAGTDPMRLDPVFFDVIDKRMINATVTQLELGGTTRATVGVRSTIYALWSIEAPLVAREPSTTSVIPSTDVYLDGEHALEPGMLVALQTRDGALAQIVELSEVEASSGVTRVRYLEITPAPHVWERGKMVVLGNIVRIAHGTLRDEVLGDSDGVTPFQRFKLKKTPLGHLATGDGVVPDIEVRVGNVRWDRVIDLGVGETPRRYKLEREHDGTTWVVFGDSRLGAIPPAGRGNITARYRVGLGTAGNVEAGRVVQLQKSHPLVDRVSNPVATHGGTEPAASEDVRTHATRYIRTFDRAVSLQDHADLALLFPGVARAAARLVDGAIELTVATTSGEPLVNSQELFGSLDKQRDTALRLVRKDPDDVAVAIRVYYEADEAFVLRDVEAAIRGALHGTDPAAPGLFTFAARDLGQAAFASEVHGVLSTVPGVTFVQVLRFDLDPGTGLRDVLQPQPHQWLRLHPTGLTFGESTEADHD